MRCVSNVGDFVPDEECNMNLRPIDVENCDMGTCAKSWFYTAWGDRVGVPVPGSQSGSHSCSGNSGSHCTGLSQSIQLLVLKTTSHIDLAL